ncbi:MAG: hypothetical protein BWY61_00984 [Firmicutes bacterium ADurb.Bin354]|nr:MAG: hypothetical protein BWY61_00984 [Firmicutes bacterium ADurb.Bin354]SCX83455.1 Uncharacterized membrane protein [Lachnospiraceae bacterium XPB1003]
MNKTEFLEKLKTELNVYSSDEVDRSISFYSEMIDDRVEDGMEEEAAVESLGSIDEIVNQIKCELPLSTLIKNKAQEKFEKHKDNGTRNAVIITLLVLGFPIWFSVLAAVFAIIFSIIITLWSIDLALWIVSLTGVVVSVAGIAAIIPAASIGGWPVLYCIGTFFVGVGMSILFFFAGLYTAKGIIKMSVALVKFIKKLLVNGK